MNDNNSEVVDYKTHILVGCASSGEMSVIYRWPHVPQQAEVQQKIGALQQGYVTFLLCTPTSIMPADNNGKRKQK